MTRPQPAGRAVAAPTATPRAAPANVRLRAAAKVNILLEVLGKRPDGYHEIRTILQTIGLYDTLECAPAPDLQLDAPDLPDDGVNLVLRAAEALQEATGCRAGAAIALRKEIPVATGLGGGSADAAAALVALNALWQLYLERAELAGIAARLGSDVPFFLLGGTVLASGRGERLEPLPDVLPRWLVIVVPEGAPADKTARIYGMLDPKWYTTGGHVATLAQRLRTDPASSWRPLGNGLEPTAMEVFPALRAARNALTEATRETWRVYPLAVGQDDEPDWNLSGAGPALFTYFAEQQAAEHCRGLLTERGYTALVAPTVTRAEFERQMGLSCIAPGDARWASAAS